VYRQPGLAAAVHTQRGPYIDALHGDGEPPNPSDLAYQLTRRATGLPLWFALVLHGTAAHEAAIRRGVGLAREAAEILRSTPRVSLVMEPELSIVLFRREGWSAADWRAWARRLLDDRIAFVAPTTWRHEPVGRLVFMHPLTPVTVIEQIAASLT
jgi:glutamate/tyrosine decarboxylase-like PLP-dependent enzyme